MLFKTTNEITVYLMLKHTQNFQDYFYPIEIIDFSRLGRALKILVSTVRFCLWPPLMIHHQDYRSILKSIVCLLANRLMIIISIQSMEYLMHDLFHEIPIGDISSHSNSLIHLKFVTRNKKNVCLPLIRLSTKN